MNCKHFGICGGCSHLDIPYGDQLRTKQKLVHDSFHFLCDNSNVIRQIAPCPVDAYYRNKMEFVFDDESGAFALGLHQKARYNKIVDIKECSAFSENTGKILDTARQWAMDNRIPIFSIKKQTGILRYLVLRETKKTKQLMCNLIVSVSPYVFEYEFKKLALNLAERLKKANVSLACMTVGLSNSKSDVALADQNYLIYGNDSIDEKIGKLTYKIFPYTFFQTNSYVCEELYNTLRELSGHSEETTAFDLFCGSGGIALYVSKVFEKIIGIELNPKSIENAALNANLNSIKNCEFVCDRVENYLSKFDFSKFKVKLSTVIIDPPRAGLQKKSVQAVIDLNPSSIIYVSCKPESILNDLQNLLQYYKITFVQPFDMFPHTPHLEIAVKLVHK